MCADKNDAGGSTFYNDPETNTGDPHSNSQLSHNERDNHTATIDTNDSVYKNEQGMDNVDYVNEGFNTKSVRHEDSAILYVNTNQKSKSKCLKPETVGGQEDGSNPPYETLAMHERASENSSHEYSVLQPSR